MERHPICRISQFLLRWALKLTAAPLVEWNQAMLAELKSVDKPFAALQWSLGCVTVVAREALSSHSLRAWRMVTGILDLEAEGGITMRNAKITAAAVVAATFLFFIATNLRQALSVAAESLIAGPLYDLGGHMISTDNPAEIDRMRQAAEQRGDAKRLAYVAIHDARVQPAIEAADHAVAIDAQWTWVYYLLAYRENVPNREALIAKLQQWDPQNAAVYMLQADKMVPATQQLPHNGEPLAITGNEPWVPLEARAFDCPKYDNYFQRHFDLEREVALGQGRSPIKVEYAALGTHPVPNLFNMRLYAEYALASAQHSPGEIKLQARRASKMGELMMSGNFIIEQFVGAGIALIGYKELAAVAPADEQMLIAARMTELRSHRAVRLYSMSLAETLAPNAMVIQASLLLILAATLTMAGSFVVLLFGRRGKGVERLLWVSSGTMLVSCIVSYVAYLPFARLLARLTYMQGPAPDSGLLYAFDGFFAVKDFAARQNASLAIYAWSGVIALLALALVMIAVRSGRQWMRPAATV